MVKSTIYNDVNNSDVVGYVQLRGLCFVIFRVLPHRQFKLRKSFQNAKYIAASISTDKKIENEKKRRAN